MHHVEVYKQADGFTTELKVGKNLGLVDGRIASTDLISTTTRLSTTRSMRYPSSTLTPR